MIVLKCPACGKKLQIDDKYRGQAGRCNGCGGDIQVPKTRQMKTVDKIAVFAVGVFIFGFLVWDPPPDPPQTAEQQQAIDPQKPERFSVAAETPIIPEPATAPPPVSELQFETIRNAMLNTTSIQADRYRKSVEGKRVVWSGWVEESREKLFGGYEVWIDMDPPSEVASVQDVSFDVTESEAVALSKNQRVEFEGTIERASEIFGSCQVTLTDASVWAAPETPRQPDSGTPSPASDAITLAQFNQIRSGMTYRQVVSILGREGTVMSENTLPNPLGGRIHTIMYMWENPGFGGNMNAMFQNDELMQKAQFGLR